MRVLNVLEEGRWGGPQKRVLLVAVELKKKGIETIVVIPKDKTQVFQKKLIENKISFYAIDFHRITKEKKHLLNYIIFFQREINQIKKIIQKENIDLVHANGSFQFKGILAARRIGIKSVWHLNDTYLIKPLKILFDKYLVNKTNGFFVAGERVRRYYLKNKVSKIPITSITPPVNTSLFNPNEIDSSVFDNYSGLKVTLVANWSQIKGHETFIRMADEVNKHLKDININFFIVGKTIENQKNYFDRLQQLVKNLNLKNLHLLGQREDIPQILNKTDISICSSNFEASPTVVWEAMSMENAIVSTDVGDVKQIFKEHNCGFVVNVKDYKGMAEKVIELAKNKSLRIKFGEKSRIVAIKNFDLESVSERHAELYQQVLTNQYE